MEKDLDRFEKLIEEHAYGSLSDQDKDFAMRFVSSGAEYDAIRDVRQSLKSVHTGSTPYAPDPAVLKSLQRQFRLSGAGAPKRWSVPAWAAVLAFVIAGGAGWYAGSTAGVKEVYVDQLVAKTDTIRVITKPDTVVVERVVFRQIPLAFPPSVSHEQPFQVPPSKGVTMKEKEELEKLLVSGGL